MKRTDGNSDKQKNSAVKEYLGISAAVCAMVAAVACLGLWLFFGFFGARLVRDCVEASTGFRPVFERAHMNVFTRKLTMEGVVLHNPRTYSDILAEKSQPFAKIRRFEADLCPWELLGGKLVFDEIALDIQSLDCVRLNASDCNIADFFAELAKVSEIEEGKTGERVLDAFSLKIAEAQKRDFSRGAKVPSERMTLPLDFAATDIDNISKMFDKLRDALDKCGGDFVCEPLKKFFEK